MIIILSFNITTDLDRRRKRKPKTEGPNFKMETLNLLSPVGVCKGSVIGVYLGTNNSIQVIRETSNNTNSNVPTGVCRTADSISVTTIDCSTGSNVQDQILHAEADISK